MNTWPLLLSGRHLSSAATADTQPCSECFSQHGGPITVLSKLGPPPVAGGGTQRPTKLLFNVHVEGSLGSVQMLMSLENDVADLMKAVVEIYVREKRRPLLCETDEQLFNLHYSQFSLDCLKREEKLINLGSRNFYLCRRPTEDLTF